MVIQEVLKRSGQDLEAMRHRQVEEQPVQETPAPIDPDPRPRDDVPVYHKPVQRASAADGAEENNGKPANDTPEQEADVPPDSRVPKEMRCIAHLLLAIRSCRCCTTWAGSSRTTARLTVRSMACESTASAAVSSNASALPWDTSPTIMKRYRIHSAEPRHR